jgi:hypothetical protein
LWVVGCWLRVEGRGLRVEGRGLRFEVQGLGFRVQGVHHRCHPGEQTNETDDPKSHDEKPPRPILGRALPWSEIAAGREIAPPWRDTAAHGERKSCVSG